MTWWDEIPVWGRVLLFLVVGPIIINVVFVVFGFLLAIITLGIEAVKDIFDAYKGNKKWK